MPPSSDSTAQLITRAKLGEESALAALVDQVEPRLRRAIDAELDAVQHDLDAGQMWTEIQDEAKRRVSEFGGSTEAEFEAWAERLALRHIRYSVSGRAGNVETIVHSSRAETLRKPSQTTDPNQTIAPGKQATTKLDPNQTIAPGKQSTKKLDPNQTIAPDKRETKKMDPNATLAPGNAEMISPNAFDIPKHDPNATITDLSSIPLAPQTTKIFGDYEILETIAKGGMGVVYKARQRKLNRIVALKMILAGQFADQEDIDRFYVEAEAAAQLRHPNIVGIFEVGECEGQHYFSMEYIDGQSLGDLVREHPLAPRVAAKFVETISDAMYYAHQEGVLHRDLKPSNVLVDGTGEPLITDFGLAKRTQEQSQRTAAGSVLGTPSYMPPEQASGKLDQISERSDVYSIGAILYELITGKPPFGAANPWETIKQVLHDEPVSPRLLNNNVPADLETICLKCLQKDQTRRYNSAQDLSDELQRFLAGEPILARPIGIVERSVRWCYRNPWPTAALGVMLLGIVGTSAGLIKARVAEGEAKASEGRALEAKAEADVAKDAAVAAQGKAEKSRDQLLAAINELFTDWGDVTLLNEPGFENMRAKLLATASKLYKQMGEQLGDDPKVQQELGVSYFRLGRMMYHLRSYDSARESLEAGLKTQRELLAAQPHNEKRLHALGESLNQYGKLLEVTAAGAGRDFSQTQQQLEAAEAVYEEAIATREELVTLFPDKPEYKRQLLNSQMNKDWIPQLVGALYADQERFDEAKSFYERSRPGIEQVQAGLRDLLSRLDETSDVRRDVIQDLAQCSYNLANVTWWLGDFKATVENVAVAVDAYDTLLAAEPNHLENQYDLAYCLMLGGDAKSGQMQSLEAGQDDLRQKLHDEALQGFERAKSTFERLASKSTSVPKYRFGVAQAAMRIGDLQLLRQEDHKALAAFQTASDVLTPMVAEFPAYLPFLEEANSAIEQTKQYIREAEPPSPAADAEETK